MASAGALQVAIPSFGEALEYHETTDGTEDSHEVDMRHDRRVRQYSFTQPRVASIELGATELQALATARQEIIPAPGPRRCVVVEDIFCLKAGDGEASAAAGAFFGLAFVRADGGRS